MFKPLVVVVVVVVVLFLVGPSVVSVGGFASENNRNIRFAVLASVSSRPSVRPSRRRGLWNGVAPPERVGTEKRADEFGAYPLQCATPGHGPRIDMAASVGEYIAYSVGAFLACVSRGITGVGAAILFLVTWVVFTMAGVETSSLKDTVALEAWIGLLTMLPFVISANIREHTNWVILTSFLPFQAACVPLGALALERVSPAYLELTFSALIALFVSERMGLFKFIGRKCRGGGEEKSDGGGSVELVSAPSEGTTEVEVTTGDVEDAENVEDKEAKIIWYKEPRKFLNAPVDNVGLTYDGTNFSFMCAWAAAGCMSGFLGGMTGTHGPPTIACYTMMKVSKDVVRATSAAVLVTVMLVRLIVYAVNGLFDISKPGVYGASGASGLVGVFFGIWAQKFLDKDRFTQILLGILGLGSVLMLYKGIDDL